MKIGGYPVADLFAGPGGLGEGFASAYVNGGQIFKSVVSIERDEHSHNTLSLRHFFRLFPENQVPGDYYSYIAGKITLDELKEKYPEQWQHVESSAFKISLGEENHTKVKDIIADKISNEKKWVLVGGPPCQAYSLVGRSRRANDPDFEEDEKHFLYKEYLKIIIDHAPPVFVMENVKGLLSAKVKGVAVVNKILDDLRYPKAAVGDKKNGLSYKLYSLSRSGELTEECSPEDFLVKSELFGVPQARHRVFILGVRSDISLVPGVLQQSEPPTVKEVLKNLPKIRSGISKSEDNPERWAKIIKDTAEKLSVPIHASFPKRKESSTYKPLQCMAGWYNDEKITALSCHESRSHMESDLQRYFFASSFAKLNKISPKLQDFPEWLLPKHKNVHEGRAGKMFSDRFRVQLPHKVSTTVTSHISKDGHYFIHYDPMQCRSLTVREAARLQTFPDNYHFEGPRTQQYHQVGNAVPPYLAKQIAVIVSDILERMPE